MIPRIAIPLPTSTDHAYNELNWPDYASAVEASGGEPVCLPLNLAFPDLTALASMCHGFLLPGSPADVNPARYGHDVEERTAPADPARERTDEFLLAHAERAGKPVLGICFGTQFLNVSRGGTLIQDLLPIPVNHSAGRAVSTAHSVLLAQASTLAGILRAAEIAEDPLPVNSSHHQAVGIVGQGLRIAARSREDGVAEAIESTSPMPFLLGVQWHPERHFAHDPASQAIFRRFVEQAAAFAHDDRPATLASAGA